MLQNQIVLRPSFFFQNFSKQLKTPEKAVFFSFIAFITLFQLLVGYVWLSKRSENTKNLFMASGCCLRLFLLRLNYSYFQKNVDFF